MSTIFTKILKGEIPSYKIYEDTNTYAFLTIEPINEGHCLVIPKEEYNHFLDLPEETYLDVWKTARKVAKAVSEAYEDKRVTIAVQGFEVPHFHVHLIPCDGPDDFDFKKASKASEEDLAKARDKVVAKL